MFMPYFNIGFGFGGGYLGGCFGGGFGFGFGGGCFGGGFSFGFNPFFSAPFGFSPFGYSLFLPNSFHQINLCSYNDYTNYRFNYSPAYQLPNVASFMPSIDLSQCTATQPKDITTDSFYNNLVSSVGKNVMNSYQQQLTRITDQTEKVKGAKEEETTQPQTVKPKDISYDAKKLETKWKNSKFAKRDECKLKNLPSEFFQKVVDVSKKINCNPDDLMAVMNFESGGTFSASKKNSIGATGLIQFTETTASGRRKEDGTIEGGLGTTCDELAKMTETEQLEYVKKYLVKASAKFDHEYLDLETLYALVLAPGNARKDVLYNKDNDGANYTQNKGLDKDGDGKITKTEAAKRVMECLA